MTAPTLETVLAMWRAKAATLEELRHEREAALIVQILGEVESSAEDYLRWVSEADAMLHSGKGRAFLRGRFPAWEREGHARWNPTRPRERQYRLLVLPRRANADRAIAEARRAARGTGADTAPDARKVS